MHGPETSFAVPERNGSVGRRRTVARPDRKPESVRALAERLPRRVWQTLPCRTTPAGEEVTRRFAFVRVVASNPVRNRHQPPRWEWLIIEWPDGADAPSDYWLSNLAEDESRERLARRSSSTTDSSKASSGSATTKAAATSASTTTPRSSPARTPSSPGNACARQRGGRSNAAAGGAAPAARPALLGRPLPHLPGRWPRPDYADVSLASRGLTLRSTFERKGKRTGIHGRVMNPRLAQVLH